MAKTLKFSESSARRDSLSRKQKKRIQDIYEEVSKEILKESDKLKAYNIIGNADKKVLLNKVVKTVEAKLSEAGIKIEKEIKSNISEICDSVFSENAKIWKKYGLQIDTALDTVSADIVDRIISGKLYQSNWSLSEAIWGSNQVNLKKINNIIAKGLASGKSAYEVAKDLEKYVKPSARTRSKVIKYKDRNGVSREYYFGDVDYNAQRLARTMLTHAYHQSVQRVDDKNPFVTGYLWNASGDRPCVICQQRDGTIYPKGQVPLDHPNGMCDIEPVIEKSDEAIIEDILDWYNSPEHTNPDMDEFAKSVNI